MSLANPLWGAPRIHGELLKLGNVGQTTVAKYMARCTDPMLLPVCDNTFMALPTAVRRKAQWRQQ
jgi:hypothetical protein